MREIPPILQDATNIAHELEHFIIYAEGFPSTKSDSEEFSRKELSSTLNSMLHDPIVDSRLEKYGFDLWANYNKEMTESISDLEGAYCPPPNSRTRIQWMFNYVSQLLDWELRSKTEQTENQYQLWFDAHFPSVAKEGQEPLALVRKMGFDTPEKMGSALKEIIDKYNLTWLTVVQP